MSTLLFETDNNLNKGRASQIVNHVIEATIIIYINEKYSAIHFVFCRFVSNLYK